MSSKLLVFDGTNLYWRNYHALVSKAFEKDGNPTFAVYGMVNSIATSVRKHRPTHLVVVFDYGKSEYRLAIWPKYKAGRPESAVVDHDDAESQLAQSQSLLTLFGVQVWREHGIEADDIIGTVVDRFKAEVDEVVVITGDKDMRQVIDHNVTVEHPGPRGLAPQVWDVNRVQEHYGVTPDRLPEVWALCGDKIDNVPGVKGIGEKTAIKFIAQYGDLQGVSLSDEKKIEGYRHEIIMSYRLVQLELSLSSFPLALDNITFTPVVPTSDRAQLLLGSLHDLGFDSLVSRWSSGTLWREHGVRLRDLQERTK